LLIDTRVVRGINIANIVEYFGEQDDQFIKGVSNANDTGIHFYDPNKCNVECYASVTPALLELDLEFCQSITSLENYHATNLDIARSRPQLILTRGQTKHPGIITGPGCVVAESNVEGGNLFAGERCRLAQNILRLRIA